MKLSNSPINRPTLYKNLCRLLVGQRVFTRPIFVLLLQVIRTMQHYEQEVAQLRRDSHAFLITLLRQPENAQVKEYLLQTMLASWKLPPRPQEQSDSD